MELRNDLVARKLAPQLCAGCTLEDECVVPREAPAGGACSVICGILQGQEMEGAMRASGDRT